MKCSQAMRDQLRWDDLSQEQRAAVEAHVRSCEACRTERRLWQAARQRARPVAMDTDVFLHRLHRRIDDPPKKCRRRLRYALASMGPALALFTGIGGWLAWREPLVPAPGVSPQAMEVLDETKCIERHILEALDLSILVLEETEGEETWDEEVL